MALKQSAETFVERAINVMDDMFAAIEARDSAAQHVALAALIGLIEMLKAEIDDTDDNTS